MDVSEIKDPNSFAAWLEDKPEEWAQVLAARCALRVAPMAWSVAALSDYILKKKHRENLTLLTFRANFISSADGKYPDDDMRAFAAAASAASAASAAADAAASAADAAFAASAASAAASAFAADAAAASAASASASASAAFAVDAFWNAVRADCLWLAHDLDLMSDDAEVPAEQAQNLMAQPLWLAQHESGNFISQRPPAEIIKAFDKFQTSTLAQETSFGLIADWYIAAQEGKTAFNKKADLAIALMSEEDWGDEDDERDCIAVMDRVAKLAGWGRKISNSKILEAQENLIGNKWIVEDNHFAIKSVVFDSDYEAANNQNTLKALESLIRKIEKFAKSAENFDDIYGWDGFAADYALLKEAIESGEADLINSVWEIYDRTLTLASYLQQDNDLRKANPTYSNAALSADHRRQLTDIVRSLAPFVRRFPSIQTEDENTANFLQVVSVNLAQNLINSAGDQQVISAKDRELINALLLAMERNGLPAEKAGVRAICSTRNLLIAAAVVIATGTMEKTDIYSKTTDWLSDKTDTAIEMVVDAPADVQSLVVQMVEEIQRQKDEEGDTINESLIASNPRKKPSS